MSATALRLTPNVPVEEMYPKGSIVVCWHCGVPLYRLQAAIYFGEPAGKSTWKYAPIGVSDLMALVQRGDLDAGQRAAIKAMADPIGHCERIPTFKPGDYADCPACKEQFVYAETRDKGDGAASFADKGYRMQLATIPPMGRARPITKGASV